MLGRARHGAQAGSYVGASCRTRVGPRAVGTRPPARSPVCAASTAAPAAPQTNAAASGTSQQQQQSGRPKQARNPDAVTVYEKPASKYLLQRLQEAPEALLQAGGSKNDSTYRCIQTIAAANTMLVTNKDSNQLLYVPGRPTPVFKATVVKTASSVADRPATDKLSVSRGSDAAGVASQLLKALLRGRSVAVKAAGPAAVATATRAIQLAREGALDAGYEVGVWPSYVKEASGDTEITLLQQLVVRQELPAAEVVLPRSAGKPLDPSIALAQRLLAKQQRLQLVVPPACLEQLPQVLAQLHEAQEEGEKRRLLLLLPLDSTQAAASAAATKSPGGNFSAQLRSSRWSNLAASQQLPGKPFYVAGGSTTPEALAAALTAQLESQELLVVRTDGSSKAANVLLQALWAAEGRLVADQGLGLCALLDVRQGAAAAAAAAAATGSKETAGKEVTAAVAAAAGGKETVGKDVPAAAAAAAGGGGSSSKDIGKYVAAAAAAAAAATGSKGSDKEEATPAMATPSTSTTSSSSSSSSTSAAPSEGDSSWGVVQALVTRRSEVALHVLQTPNKPLQVTCAPELADAALRSAAALNALLAMDEAGRGGLLLSPVLLASGELQLKFERLGTQLQPGLGDPQVEEFRVSHATQPDALRGGIITRVAQHKAAQLTLASGGAASWRALMGVAVARLELTQMRQQRAAGQGQGLEGDKGLLPELLGVVVTLGRQQLDSGDSKQMYGMRLVWQD